MPASKNIPIVGEVTTDIAEPQASRYYEPTENDRELLGFVVSHTDRWRDYRKQNYDDAFDRYERIFRGIWEAQDKNRQSERSRIISPATQQAIETSHAETMEAIFGQDEFFDIDDDVNDTNGRVDVEKLKKLLKEDFAQDKIRKSFDAIVLLAKCFGTGLGEIQVTKENKYYPMQIPIGDGRAAYGTGQKERVAVKLVPINPKNFIFDPNGTSIDDCMGVAIERYVSIHKIAEGIKAGRYLDVNITSMQTSDELEPTTENSSYKDDKVKLLVYYGLVPKEYLNQDEEVEKLIEESELEDYSDMVEAIVCVANDGILLKREESPYMMKDRPVLAYQDDTVPNRLFGRGVAEKADNSQRAIDASARFHMDSLALTAAPMMGIDATRVPRGMKFEVKPGGTMLTNGSPADVLFPFKFGTNDGQSMTTSKEFERMLLMATGTIDSNGTVQQVSRDANMDMATATMIKKYKRTLTNFQEDFLIPFIYKAVWRYMQFDPDRYPSVDVKFIPTGTLGIIAREYEQKQLAFLIQTLGAESPLTPILMQGVLKNSSLQNREEILEHVQKTSQPDPEQQQMQKQAQMLELKKKQAEVAKTEAEAMEAQANAQKARVEAQTMPDLVKAKIIAALSNNLDDDAEGKDFERRARIADLMLKERDIESNENIAKLQVSAKMKEKQQNDDYVAKASEFMQ